MMGALRWLCTVPSPQAIMLLLVNKVKEGLQSRLVGRLYRHDQFEALLLENPQVAYEVKHIRNLWQ
jgi:hypothetical protein